MFFSYTQRLFSCHCCYQIQIKSSISRDGTYSDVTVMAKSRCHHHGDIWVGSISPTKLTSRSITIPHFNPQLTQNLLQRRWPSRSTSTSSSVTLNTYFLAHCCYERSMKRSNYFLAHCCYQRSMKTSNFSVVTFQDNQGQLPPFISFQ